MPADLYLEVIGLENLRKQIARAQDAGMKKSLRDANKSAAQVVVKRALPLVPVKTGRLRSSVRALGSQAKANVRAGNTSVRYAAAVHWGRGRGATGGRSGLGGSLYLWRAKDAALASGEIEREYEKSMRDLLHEHFE